MAAQKTTTGDTRQDQSITASELSLLKTSNYVLTSFRCCHHLTHERNCSMPNWYADRSGRIHLHDLQRYVVYDFRALQAIK